MSREFGNYGVSGYFHDKIRDAARDCEVEGEAEITKLWGKFLDEFYHIAYDIASFEAGDSGEWAPISETIQRLPRIEEILSDIKHYIRPYKDVAAAAIREHVRATERAIPLSTETEGGAA